MNKIGAIILAAGKGSRMKAKKSNKVTYILGDKPMIMHVVHLLENLKLKPTTITIGLSFKFSRRCTTCIIIGLSPSMYVTLLDFFAFILEPFPAARIMAPILFILYSPY